MKKKILFIEDSSMVVDSIIGSLGIFLFKSPTIEEVIEFSLSTKRKLVDEDRANFELGFLKSESSEQLLETLSSKELFAWSSSRLKEIIDFEFAVSCEEVKKKYQKKKYDLIILDGDLSDGSTERIFDIFSLDDYFIVHSAGFDFREKAKKFGFKNFADKEIDIQRNKVNEVEILQKIAALINQ